MDPELAEIVLKGIARIIGEDVPMGVTVQKMKDDLVSLRKERDEARRISNENRKSYDLSIEEMIMSRMYYYTPPRGDEKAGVIWDTINDRHMTANNDLDAIDKIKEFEQIKRIPPTWKIFIEKTPGEFLEVNRRSISRKRMEAKRCLRATKQ